MKDEEVRLAALRLIANIIPISGSQVLVAVRSKDIIKLAKALGYKGDEELLWTKST